MAFGIIYKVTNKLNGKVYIGQTVQSLRRRINGHYFDVRHNRYNSILHKALKKYDRNVFKWEVLEECSSKEEMDEMEFHYIKQYNSYGSGYNSTLGGEGSPGCIRTEEIKQKISISMRGDKAYWYGKHHTEETKKRISIKNSGSNHPNFGKKLSKTTRAKIAKSHTGMKRSSEAKLNMSKSQKGLNVGSKSPCSKKYVINTPGGKEFIVDGLIDFCRNYENERLNYKNLSQVANGEKKHHKGYKCRYFNGENK